MDYVSSKHSLSLFDWTKSLYPDFFDSVRSLLPNRINSVKWLWWILTRWPLCCKSLVRVVSYEIWWISLHYVFKNHLNELLLCSVHCTVYTETTLCEITPTACQIASTPYHEVTLTPYHEWTRTHQLLTMNAHSLSTLSSYFHSVYSEDLLYQLYGAGVTAFIHGTELMRLGKVTLRSTKISIRWLWPVKMTLEVIKRRLMVLCWSCDMKAL